MKRAIVPALLVAGVSVLRAQSDPSWRQPFDSVRIVGNAYVGTRGLSSFLIVTPAGGIVIFSGEAETVPHAIKADVFVAQHGGVFALEDKARRAAADPRVNPFVDPEGYQRFVERSKQAYLKQRAQDQKQKR